MENWYIDWFNTKEYLYVYKHRNEKDAEELVNLIQKNTQISENSTVLDLASGTGRHSILFAKRNYKVTAVDLSENLLSVAKKSSENAGVKINFINGDWRHFFIDARFDLVVNLFTSFGYFQDDYENFLLFRVAHQHLKKNGYFVIDFFNSFYLERNLITHSSIETPAGKITLERKIENKRVIKKISINNGSFKQYFESVKLYSVDEITAAMENEGLKIIQKYGDFYGNNFDIENSPRIIIIARK